MDEGIEVLTSSSVSACGQSAYTTCCQCRFWIGYRAKGGARIGGKVYCWAHIPQEFRETCEILWTMVTEPVWPSSMTMGSYYTGSGPITASPTLQSGQNSFAVSNVVTAACYQFPTLASATFATAACTNQRKP